jgi:cysteinyl-tRNA synthetase
VKNWLHTGHLFIEGRKMSKSLKNFISIKEFFDTCPSDSPANDFRIFCLQYHYSSSLSYSQDRIDEATHYRKKLNNYFNLVNTIISRFIANSTISPDFFYLNNDKSISKKPTPSSFELEEFFRHSKKKINLALKTDFDTPEVLNIVSDIIGKGTQYINKFLTRRNDLSSSAEPIDPLEPILTISNYVRELISLLGIQLPVNTDKKNEENSGFPSDLIDDVLEIRSTIRQEAIEGIREIKKIKKSIISSRPLDENIENLSNCFERLLSECDKTRDILSSSMKIKIEDLPGNVNKWEKK